MRRHYLTCRCVMILALCGTVVSVGCSGGDDDEEPMFADAKKKEGPVRYWFTRDAVARFVGCYTWCVAKRFAEDVLRKGATSYGTSRTVRHAP